MLEYFRPKQRQRKPSVEPVIESFTDIEFEPSEIINENRPYKPPVTTTTTTTTASPILTTAVNSVTSTNRPASDPINASDDIVSSHTGEAGYDGTAFLQGSGFVLALLSVLKIYQFFCRRKKRQNERSSSGIPSGGEPPCEELVTIHTPARDNEQESNYSSTDGTEYRGLEQPYIPPPPLPPAIRPSFVPEVLTSARARLMEEIQSIYAVRNRPLSESSS